MSTPKPELTPEQIAAELKAEKMFAVKELVESLQRDFFAGLVVGGLYANSGNEFINYKHAAEVAYGQAEELIDNSNTWEALTELAKLINLNL